MFEQDLEFFRTHLDPEKIRQMTVELRSIEGECDAPHCERSARWCLEQLRRAGASQVEMLPVPGDGERAFNDCIIPRVWESTGHSFLKDEKGEYLVDTQKEPRALPPWSAPTPEEGITAFVTLTPEKNCWLLSERLTPQVLQEANAAAAAGVILNTVTAPVEQGTVRWENGSGLIGWYPVAGDPPVTLFAIPPEKGKVLTERIRKGERPLLCGVVRRENKKGLWNSVTGIIPGEESTEILLCAHLYEPFAADNAVSTPLLLELCRLIAENKAPLLRHTIRFWFGLERYGLAHYVSAPERSRKILYLLNADCIANRDTGAFPRLTFYGSSPAQPFFADSHFGAMAQKLLAPDSVGISRGEMTGDTFVSDLEPGIPSMLLESCDSRFWHLTAPEFDAVDYGLAPRAGAFYGACALWLGRKENPERRREVTALAAAEPEKAGDLPGITPYDKAVLKNEMIRAKRKKLLSAASFEEVPESKETSEPPFPGPSSLDIPGGEGIFYRPRPLQILSLAAIPREKRKNPPAVLPEFRLLWSLIDGERSLYQVILAAEALTGKRFSAEQLKAFRLHLDYLKEYGLLREK